MTDQAALSDLTGLTSLRLLRVIRDKEEDMPIKIVKGLPNGTFNDAAIRVTDAIRKHDAGYLPGLDSITEKAYAGSANQWTGNRPKWFKGCRREVYAKLPWQWLDDGTIAVAKCQFCSYSCTVQGMQIDHYTGWFAYITQFIDNWITNLEARILYNDPEILRLTCSICNSSHPEARPISRNTQGGIRTEAQTRIMELIGVRDLDTD